MLANKSPDRGQKTAKLQIRDLVHLTFNNRVIRFHQQVHLTCDFCKFSFSFEKHLLLQTFSVLLDRVILFPAVFQSNTKSHPTQEQPGNINWPPRYPLMDRTHFISNLTFNEYIFYLPMPVIGISSPFREMVVLGLFVTDLFSSTGT